MIQNSQNINGDSPSASNFQIDPIGLLRRKFWTICFFVLLCTALSILFFFKAPKTYESTAKFFIIDNRAAAITTEGDPIGESNVQKFIQILNSHRVLDGAIQLTDTDDMKSLEDVDDIMLAVRENMKVDSADNKALSDVIKVRYQCGVEDDCQVMLTNIMTSFDSFVESTNRDAGGKMRDSMDEVSGKQLARKKMIEDEISELSKKPYVHIKDQQVYNQYEDKASGLQIELDELSSQRLGYTTLLNRLDEASASGQNVDEMIVEILQGMSDSPVGDDAATQQSYLELKVREQELMGDYGSDHPELKNVRSQLLVVEQLRKEHLLSKIRTDSSIQSSEDFLGTVRKHVENKIGLAEFHEAELIVAIAES